MFVEAFCLLYKQKPIQKISIQDIAKKAGYNRSTFYQYFFDIDDLLSYVEKSFLSYIHKKQKEIDFNSDSYINVLVDIYENKSIICNALLGAHGSHGFLNKVKEKTSVPGLNLQDGNKFKPYLVEYRLSGAFALFKLWLQRGAEKDLPLKDFMDMALTLYKNGISSFKSAI